MIDGKLLYPIGSIYMSIQDTNPSVFFGGTWERIAKGKTLVGVDESDTDFNASSKTGGEKTHTLTIDEMPKHRHTLDYYSVGTGGGGKGAPYNGINDSFVGGDPSGINYEGANNPHNNIQPYYTCYIFVRTA